KGFFPKLLQATVIDVLEAKASGGVITGFRNTTDGCSIRSLTAAASGFKSGSGNWISPIHLNDTNLFLGYIHMYGKPWGAGGSKGKDEESDSSGEDEGEEGGGGNGSANGEARKKQQNNTPIDVSGLEVDNIHLDGGAFLFAQYAHFEGAARYACSCG